MIKLLKIAFYIVILIALFVFIQYRLGFGSLSADQIKTYVTSTLPIFQPQSTSVYIVGDMMFDRAVRKTIQTSGYDYVFGETPTLFAHHDIVVGNLEGSITTYPSKTLFANGTMSTDLVFTFPTSTAPALKKEFDAAGVQGVVSLANNHAANFGREGIDQTKAFLKAQDIQYFGDPNNAIEIATTTCVHGTCIGIIGYHEFTYINESAIAQKIKAMRPTVDFLMVFPHWGVEYNQSFTARQQKYAHTWIDAGADAVIGAHPHVIEPIEIYKGKAIFYSLGNYIFDQYFSFNTIHGLTVGLSFNASSTTYTLIPIQNKGITIKKDDASTTATILKSLATYSRSSVSSNIDQEIMNGSFTLSR